MSGLQNYYYSTKVHQDFWALFSKKC